MLKRKFFIRYENESNEQFEKRINEFIQKDDEEYHSTDNVGHSTFGSSNGKILCILFHHATEDEAKKQKVGF